ncbi:uncharacterized protein LOC110467255 [Mizuhopecten yessoensis]|uniref:2'-phosphotransferase n=1 Tax=Mizuhopecten yessoensis TaxID=6573 RepID=A0A210PMA3_MIZYE|nr:uncharacterized protein LOC110467255 [Mizuhopecten yessoensis]OWF37615.1 tRNA 2'-phosphotransferase 1 [Mizuhopecten yessoensis]
MANYPQNYPGAWAEHNAGRGVQYNSTPQPQIGPQDGGQHHRVSQNEEFRSPPRPDRETSNMAGQRVNRPGQYDRSPSPKNRNRSARGEGGYRNDGMWRGGPQSPQSDSSFGSPQSNYYQNRWRDNERKVYESSPSYQRNSRWDHNNSPRNYHSDSSQSSGSGRHRDRDPDVHLSKKLSFLLRHGAEKSGFTLMSGGFLYVEDILKLPELQEFSLKDVRRIVENNDKQRFALQPNPENKKMMIRANQGHTMQVQNLDLKPITSAEEAQEVIHGTYYKSWEIIKHSGLSRMGRNHIHFAAGEPGENGVISGMRSSCEVVIRIDMEKALNDGLKFFRSANNVILCAGDKDGIIYPAYFDVVIQRHPRMMIHFDKCVTKANAQEVPSKSKKSKKTKKREREEDSEGGKKKTGRQEKKKEEKNEDQSDSIEYDLQNDFLEGSNSKEAACEEKRKKTDTPAVDEKINKAVDEIPNQPVAEEANQPEDVTDAWDDGQQEAESDVLVEEEYTTTKIDDADISKCTLKEICEKKSAVAVRCYGDKLGEEGGSISHIMCVDRKDCFLFPVKENPTLMTEGTLQDFLTSKAFPKVFHGCGKVSKTLFDEFEVLLDGTNIYDTKVVYTRMKDGGEGNMGDFEKIKFCPDNWPEDQVSDLLLENDPEERDRCVTILKAYEIMINVEGMDRKYKKDIFEEANGIIGQDVIKEFKKNKAKQAKSQSEPSSQKAPSQKGPSQKAKQGGKKKNKK